jgi:hypothetical protein
LQSRYTAITAPVVKTKARKAEITYRQYIVTLFIVKIEKEFIIFEKLF